MPDDSMAPEIVSGAKTIINSKQTSITENKIYLVKSNQRILLRKLFIIKLDQEFLLKSVNSNYPEETISSKKLEIIGRAVGLIWQPLE
jgi:phage repressor protein C with HTH and peptisase S24 domain